MAQGKKVALSWLKKRAALEVVKKIA